METKPNHCTARQIDIHREFREPTYIGDSGRAKNAVLNRFGDFDCSGPHTLSEGRGSISGAAYLN